VYYANYLKFAERARTEALRKGGIGQRELFEKHGVAFVVRSCEAEFLRPARLDDCLTIETKLTDSGPASLRLEQAILRGREVLVTFSVRLGVVDARFKPARMPADLRKKLPKIFA
jgi:acyl-CoA thioester hydrolase